MRFLGIVGAAALVTLAAGVTLTASGVAARQTPKVCCAGLANACCIENRRCCVEARQSDRVTRGTQWSIVNFVDAVLVNRTFVSGPVLIVHDERKMVRGEPCTTFYRFDPVVGQKQALVSFHCVPLRANRADTTTLTTTLAAPGVKRLVAYQIAGETEAHGIPQ